MFNTIIQHDYNETGSRPIISNNRSKDEILSILQTFKESLKIIQNDVLDIKKKLYQYDVDQEQDIFTHNQPNITDFVNFLSNIKENEMIDSTQCSESSFNMEIEAINNDTDKNEEPTADYVIENNIIDDHENENENNNDDIYNTISKHVIENDSIDDHENEEPNIDDHVIENENNNDDIYNTISKHVIENDSIDDHENEEPDVANHVIKNDSIAEHVIENDINISDHVIENDSIDDHENEEPNIAEHVIENDIIDEIKESYVADHVIENDINISEHVIENISIIDEEIKNEEPKKNKRRKGRRFT
jgi:hypothetical protein